jgi:hypothetical protein
MARRPCRRIVLFPALQSVNNYPTVREIERSQLQPVLHSAYRPRPTNGAGKRKGDKKFWRYPMFRSSPEGARA